MLHPPGLACASSTPKRVATGQLLCRVTSKACQTRSYRRPIEDSPIVPAPEVKSQAHVQYLRYQPFHGLRLRLRPETRFYFWTPVTIATFWSQHSRFHQSYIMMTVSGREKVSSVSQSLTHSLVFSLHSDILLFVWRLPGNMPRPTVSPLLHPPRAPTKIPLEY